MRAGSTVGDREEHGAQDRLERDPWGPHRVAHAMSNIDDTATDMLSPTHSSDPAVYIIDGPLAATDKCRTGCRSNTPIPISPSMRGHEVSFSRFGSHRRTGGELTGEGGHDAEPRCPPLRQFPEPRQGPPRACSTRSLSR